MKVSEIIMSNSIQESTLGDAWKVLRGTAKVAEPAAAKVKPGFIDRAAAKIDAANLAKAEKVAAQQKFALVTSHYGAEATSWLSKLNLLEAAAEYWWKSSQLDKQLESGAIDQQTYDQEIIKLRGIAITQWIAPKIGYWVANKAAALTLVKQLPGLIKFLRMPNAASILRDFSKPVVQAAMIAFVMTPGGKRWLMDTFGAFIIGVGSIPTLASKLWDVVSGVYDAALYGDKEDDTEEPNTAGGKNAEIDDISTPSSGKPVTIPKKSMPYDISTRDLK